MTKLNRPTGLLGICGALILSTATAAQASDIQYSGSHVASLGQSFGNSNFGARYDWVGAQGVSSVNDSSGSEREYYSSEFFQVSATLFGQTAYPIEVVPGSQVWGTTNDSSWGLQAGAYSGAWVMGTNIYLSGASTCTPASNHVRYCSTFDRSISRTLFSTSASFTVGFVPVTVSASVVGNLHAGLSTSADATRFFGLNDTAFETLNSAMNASAYVQANLSAFAGISGVLAVGVSGSFKLIDIAVSPNSFQRTDADSGGYAGTWYNKLPLALSSMSGSVDVWAEITPFWKPSVNLISWPGLVWNFLAVDDTANFDTNSGFTF